MKRIAKFISRIKLPDTKLGNILKTVGALVGIGGTAAVTLAPGLLFELTGDTVVDVVIVIVSGVVIYFSGKYPVPDSHKSLIEED